MEKWKRLCAKIGRDRFLIMIIGGLLLLVITYPLPSGKSKGMAEDDGAAQGTYGNVSRIQESGLDEANAENDYEKIIEERLSGILSNIYGAGKVEVFISFSDYGTNVVEKDVSYTRDNEEKADGNTQKTSSVLTENSEETVYTTDEDGREVPFVNRMKTPEVEGVLIVAQGGQNPTVEQEMKEAIMALFGIEEHKIKVVKMKGEEQ